MDHCSDLDHEKNFTNFIFDYYQPFMRTISEQRGFRTWEKKVEIIEQKGRRFKGTFSYTDGTKNFFGVIHPDNLTITWVNLS